MGVVVGVRGAHTEAQNHREEDEWHPNEKRIAISISQPFSNSSL
jgi:hypothetical protein